jgi:hypothetical protein
MSESLTIEQLENKMRPGRSSNGGFLGVNESLLDVITKDEHTLRKYGVTHEIISGSIEKIWNTAVNEKQKLATVGRFERETDFPQLHKPETIPSFTLKNLPDTAKGFIVGRFQVFIVQYRGFQICPWSCNVFGSSDFMVLNRITGETFTAPELIVHLIREHQFFEGFLSPYRVDPERVIRTLEIPQTHSAG